MIKMVSISGIDDTLNHERAFSSQYYCHIRSTLQLMGKEKYWCYHTYSLHTSADIIWWHDNVVGNTESAWLNHVHIVACNVALPRFHFDNTVAEGAKHVGECHTINAFDRHVFVVGAALTRVPTPRGHGVMGGGAVVDRVHVVPRATTRQQVRRATPRLEMRMHARFKTQLSS